MAVDEKTIERIRKLLALGTSSNEHEAASALAKAQELMEQNDLAVGDIENAVKADDAVTEEANGRVLVRKGKPEAWKESIARVVASTSDVWLSYRTEYVEVPDKKWGGTKYETQRQHYFIGLKRDVEFAGYALSFLIGELDRLANEYTRERWNEIWAFADERGYTHQTAESIWVSRGRKHPLASRKYWLEGAADGVQEALRADKRARRQASDATNALVVLKEEAIRDWYYKKHYGMTYAEYKAKQAADSAKWAAEHPNAVTTEAKPESPSARRRREEAERRRQQRDGERYWKAFEREQRKKDHNAFEAGREAGRKVGVRPGVGGGTKAAEQDRLVS